MDGQWDVVISSLQVIYNSNETTSFDDDLNAKRINFHSLSREQLQAQLEYFQEHKENIIKARQLINTAKENLDTVIKHVSENSDGVPSEPQEETRAGRSFWTSPYNPSDPILLGSEVAYKPRKSGDGEWIQCEVIKISTDGTRFEVRDPEPDEFGNTGQVFKCNWKDIILIPPKDAPKHITPNYPPGTKVLARYPETTTFYPAVVIGNKRDGTCRMRFDGEEEVDKETDVIRRLVLPSPTQGSSKTHR